MNRAVALVSGALPLPGLLAGAYLLRLLGASRRPARELPAPTGQTRFVVVVPAHDEAPTITPVLERLLAVDHPADRFQVVVVADNCTDDTAAVAAAAGVRVLERRDPDRRGKGHALRWAFDQLLPEADAVAVVDADCLVSENFAAACERRLLAGADAVQVGYVTSNPDESSHAALRHAAYLLFCGVRPAGKDALGLSAGLFGTGMCFRASALEAVPWAAFTLAEDREYHLALVASGRRVAFAGEASVTSWMPASYDEAEGQAMRWDSGRLQLAASAGRALVARAVRERDPVALDAALEPLMPPQALLAGMNGGALLATIALRRRRAAALALLGLGAQAAWVVGGLRSAGAPPAVWRGIADVPGFVAARLRSLVSLGLGRGPGGWVRGERDAAAG